MKGFKILFRRYKPLIVIVFALVIVYNTYNSIYSIRNGYKKQWNKLSRLQPDEAIGNTEPLLATSLQGLGNRLTEESTLREQLAYQYPYDPQSEIPKFIWQTWKYAKDDARLSKKFKKNADQWEALNPEYNYNLIPDSISQELIETLYKSVPQVLNAYNLLPKTILKADFFRYLILFARGGVYSDIDTVGIKPVKDWVVSQSKIYGEVNNGGLIIGIEADPDRPDWNDYYARRIQFCQWTIMSKVGHPMLGELIAKITEITLKKKENGELNKITGKDAGGDIMNWTGPGIFTDEIFKYLQDLLKYKSRINIKNMNEKNEYNSNIDLNNPQVVDWRFFTLMTQPVVFDDVIVLPITSFSPGVGHMGSRATDDEMAYVHHLFEGSWKDDKKVKPKGNKGRG